MSRAIHSVGLKEPLLTEEHFQRQKLAVWLFAWLVGRQTKANGIVLGGKPLSYEYICEETGWGYDRVKSWMTRLRREHYIRVKHTTFKRMIVWVCNQKKYGAWQGKLPLELEAYSGKSPELNRAESSYIEGKIPLIKLDMYMRDRESGGTGEPGFAHPSPSRRKHESGAQARVRRSREAAGNSFRVGSGSGID